MTSSTNQAPITREDVANTITGFVSDLFRELFERPDAMAVADQWMRGEVVFLVTRSGLAAVPADDPRPESDPGTGLYL
ncbi:hypothetical protein Aple_034250 [Acrocarpospora pleiomorpha]|uniref:Uncharacterized protein n=1 Tax=Acrocarpospora pleiomorpha TaxID=90975 RepID=A0A5M3XK66_9ACTN|nr:hypothetical protein [Acrocarpospora pleiomorpha]GES20529.1 hypothetical protein Aple_034250 [Acrocarpospora pleiomorpha]